MSFSDLARLQKHLSASATTASVLKPWTAELMAMQKRYDLIAQGPQPPRPLKSLNLLTRSRNSTERFDSLPGDC